MVWRVLNVYTLYIIISSVLNVYTIYIIISILFVNKEASTLFLLGSTMPMVEAKTLSFCSLLF